MSKRNNFLVLEITIVDSTKLTLNISLTFLARTPTLGFIECLVELNDKIQKSKNSFDLMNRADENCLFQTLWLGEIG